MDPAFYRSKWLIQHISNFLVFISFKIQQKWSFEYFRQL